MKQPSSSFVFDEGCFFIIHENLNFPIVHWEKDLTKSFLRNLATLEFAKKNQGIIQMAEIAPFE